MVTFFSTPIFTCIFFSTDASSLCLKLHISGSGPSWCEFVGTINSAPFFKYSCKSQMAKPINFLGMEENDTEAWNQRCEHLKELVEELRKALLDYKQNISKARKFARSRVEVDSVVGLGNNCVFVNIGILSYPRGPTARVGHSGQIRTRRWGKQRAGY